MDESRPLGRSVVVSALSVYNYTKLIAFQRNPVEFLKELQWNPEDVYRAEICLPFCVI